MIFERFEAKGLSQFSYAIGYEGEIAIIDPEQDISTYISYLQRTGYIIKFVLETHIHADFASGARALAEATGAELCLSAYDTGEKYEYNFPHRELKDGDHLHLGRVIIEAQHTPGHTPEHLSFLVRDEGHPQGYFSGDFLFVHSLGRPDLLGEAEKKKLASQLYHSVQRLKTAVLQDELPIYPGHGAGSLCGGGMGKASTSTLGDEKAHNPFFSDGLTESAFIDKILGISPPFPPYYLRMKELNAAGSAIGELKMPPAMNVEEFSNAYESGVVLDMRSALQFGAAHLYDSINIPQADFVSSWGAWVLPYDQAIYIVANGPEQVQEGVRALARVGITEVKGYLDATIEKWINEGNDFNDIPQASVYFLDDLMELGDPITIIDVRSEAEYADGHVKGAKNIYLGNLEENLKGIKNKDDLYFCICGGGSRSSIAASIMAKNGFEAVYNVMGGMGAWKKADLTVVKSKSK